MSSHIILLLTLFINYNLNNFDIIVNETIGYRSIIVQVWASKDKFGSNNVGYE